MEEQIVDFKTAKLAKEKGFDGYCYDAYNKNGMQYSNGWCEYIDDNEEDIPFNKSILRNNDVLAPTQDLLRKWLLEIHSIHITIFSKSQESWMYRVTIKGQSLEKGLYGEDFYSHDDAREEALFQALLKI